MLRVTVPTKRAINIFHRLSSSSSVANISVATEPDSESSQTSTSNAEASPSIVRKLTEENRVLPIKYTGPDTKAIIRRSREEVASQIAAGAIPRMPFRLWRLIFAKCNDYTINRYVTLSKEEKTVHAAHWRAMQERRLTYKDPFNDDEVITAAGLLIQERCCGKGNGCRHCPYDHENVPEELKKLKKWNGAYYV